MFKFTSHPFIMVQDTETQQIKLPEKRKRVFNCYILVISINYTLCYNSVIMYNCVKVHHYI